MLLVLGIAGACAGMVFVAIIIARHELHALRKSKADDQFWKIVTFNDLDLTDEHEG
jgi:H+/Cl- antiporter ClcA